MMDIIYVFDAHSLCVYISIAVVVLFLLKTFSGESVQIHFGAASRQQKGQKVLSWHYQGVTKNKLFVMVLA